jgi:hypothetical protein
MFDRVRKIQRDFSCCKAIIDRDTSIWSYIWPVTLICAVGKIQKLHSRLRGVDRALGGILLALSYDVIMT